MRIFSVSLPALAFATLLTYVAPAEAALLQFRPSDASIEDVKLAAAANLVSPDGKTIELKPYLKGLRRKKVAVFWAKVYVGQIFTSEPLPAPKSMSEASAALLKQSTVGISMTFVRHVTADQMKAAFADAFEKNDINPETDKSVAPLFAILQKGGDMQDKQTMNIVLSRAKDGTENLMFDNGKGEIQSANIEKDTAGKMLKLWVGKPADSGVERLQNQFLGKDD